MPNLLFLARRSLHILSKTQTGVFPISGFLVNSLQKEIVIPPEPVMLLISNLEQYLTIPTRQDQQDNVKKIDDADISEICDTIAIFLIYGQFGAIRKPDSGCIV